MDNLYTFWASELLVNHGDGMAGDANNFYFYVDPNDNKANFIPWGADKTFGESKFSWSGLLAYTNSIIPFTQYNDSTSQDLFAKELNRLLTEVWNEDELLSEIDRVEALLLPLMNLEPIGKDTSSKDGAKCVVSAKDSFIADMEI